MLLTGKHPDLKPILDLIGTPVSIFEFNGRDWYLVSGNDLFADLFQISLHLMVDQLIGNLFPRYMHFHIRESFTNCLLDKTAVECEQPIDIESKTTWLRMVFVPVLLEGNVIRIILTLIDISDKKQLEYALAISEQRHTALLNATYDGIISVDSSMKINSVNTAAKDMFGIDDSILNQPLNVLLPERFREGHSEKITAFRQSPIKTRAMENRRPVTALRKDGSEFPIEVTISKIKVGDEVEFTAVIRDLAVNTDALTNVCNRKRIDEILKMEYSRSERYAQILSVLLVDIDDFKSVNDTYGHLKGDLVLKEVARRLLGVVRTVDTIGRWGGEEFIVILPSSSEEQAHHCAERILSAMNSVPFEIDNHKLTITVSIGMATVTKGETLLNLFSKSDDALYKAKASGKNQICCFD